MHRRQSAPQLPATSYVIEVTPRSDSTAARWLALDGTAEQVRVTGRHPAAASAAAALPGAALAVVRGRVDDATPGQPGPVLLRRYQAAGFAQQEAAGWHLAGVTPARARTHRRRCGGLPALVGWLSVLGRPMPLGLALTAMLAGFAPEQVLSYLAHSDWAGWPSTLEDVLAETTRLRLSPQDVLACLALGLHETDAGCPTWRRGRGQLVVDVARRSGMSPARVASYLAAGAEPEQIVAAATGTGPIDLTLLERVPGPRSGDGPALEAGARTRALPLVL